MDSNSNSDTLRKVCSQRLPPPSLFQVPPSHNNNASNPPLKPRVPSVAAPGSSTSHMDPSPPCPFLHRGSYSSYSPKPHEAPGSLSPFLSARTQSRGEVDGSDALWEEMQSALSDVEVSAAARGHVFGEKHSEALEDLRTKHLRLAQAWARSEAEDGIADSNKAAAPAATSRKASSTTRKASSTTRKDSRATGAGVGAGDNSTETDGSSRKPSRSLDEETEKDILLARERREANDRYFDRVNNSVVDVVAKLEEIAQAMRTMEAESKDIWSEDDSLSTATQSTAHTNG